MVKITVLTDDHKNYLKDFLFNHEQKPKYSSFLNFYKAVRKAHQFDFAKRTLKNWFEENVDEATLPKVKRGKITPEIDGYLRSMYYNPDKSGSFSGITQFYNAVKADGKYDISIYMIGKWLRSNTVYTTTRKVTPNF